MAEQQKPNQKDQTVEGSENRVRKFYSGATRNPDGSWDFSNALEATGKTHDEFERSIAEADQKREDDKQAELASIDELINSREGTPNVVWYKLKKAITMNREAASAGDERAKKTISRLSTQQKVFDAVSRFADGIEGEDRFEAYVQAMDNLLSQWSTDSMDGKSKPTVWLRDLNIEDVMEAAGEVERKLFDERERAKHQKENPSASTASTEPGQNEKAEIDERLEEERAKFGTVVQMVKANLQDGNLGTYFEAFIKSSPNIEQYVAATKELMSINKDFLMDENHHQRVQEYVTRVKEVAERLASK